MARLLVLIFVLVLAGCDNDVPAHPKVIELRTEGVIIDSCKDKVVYRLNGELWVVLSKWTPRRVESVLAACRI